MDGFELNKIMGAVLATCLFVLSVNIVAGAVFAPQMPEKPGYVVEVPEAGETAAQVAEEKLEPITVRLAKADLARGEAAVKACVACHSFEKGGPNKVGPNLWDTVQNKRAHIDGFSYSTAMREKGGTWDVESLDRFLANPRAEVKGTTMAYAGVRRPDTRADIIAYMNTLSDSPKPLPAPTQDAAAPQPDNAAPAAPSAPDGTATPQPEKQ